MFPSKTPDRQQMHLHVKVSKRGQSLSPESEATSKRLPKSQAAEDLRESPLRGTHFKLQAHYRAGGMRAETCQALAIHDHDIQNCA